MTREDKHQVEWALDDLDILVRQLSKVPSLSSLSDFIAKRTKKIRQALKDDLPVTKQDVEKIF